MSVGGEDLPMEERQRLVSEAVDRIEALLAGAQAVAFEAMREAAGEVDRICQQVLAVTGVEVVPHVPEKLPQPMDVPLDDLAQLVEQCGSLLAGAALLAPHVRHGAARTVGSVVKADVPIAVGAAALDYLRKSKFYAPEGETA